MLSKKELRKAMNDRLHQLTEGEKAAASAAVCARLSALPQYQQARSIMAFLHMPDEVSLDGLIQQALADGKEVYVPVCVDKHRIEGRRLYTLEQAVCGAYGIRTAPPDNPRIEADELDVIFVPGLAFDARGGRLGYGAGYYDRYLARTRCPRYGLAFSTQIVGDVCASTWDEPMDGVITERPQG